MRQRIIIAGKAGSGKDHLATKLKEMGYTKDLSFTTRPKRAGEVEGIHYHYVSEMFFDTMKASEQFYETASFNGWQYGTSTYSWLESKVFIMTPKGINEVRKEDRDECFIVYLDIDEDVRRERIARRSDADSVERRMEADRKDFENFTDFDFRIQDSNFNVDDILKAWEKMK